VSIGDSNYQSLKQNNMHATAQKEKKLAHYTNGKQRNLLAKKKKGASTKHIQR
jgi:hypothetical protein